MADQKPWYDTPLVTILTWIAVILGGYCWYNWSAPKPKPSDVRFETRYLRGDDGTRTPYTVIVNDKTGERSQLIFNTQ
jgi:hypothetical protein